VRALPSAKTGRSAGSRFPSGAWERAAGGAARAGGSSAAQRSLRRAGSTRRTAGVRAGPTRTRRRSARRAGEHSSDFRKRTPSHAAGSQGRGAASRTLSMKYRSPRGPHGSSTGWPARWQSWTNSAASRMCCRQSVASNLLCGVSANAGIGDASMADASYMREGRLRGHRGVRGSAPGGARSAPGQSAERVRSPVYQACSSRVMIAV
jgi:hypothetical protein